MGLQRSIESNARKPVTRGQKAVAACSGAVLTSLTMTPFDVVKTRLQTQAAVEPLFVPSNRLSPIGPPASPLPGPSSRPATGPGISALRSAPSNPATCCHATFFTSNGDAALTCVHDPRVVVGPSRGGAGSSSVTMRPSKHPSTGTDLVHNHSRSVRSTAQTARYARGASSNAAIAQHARNSATICAFPDRVEAVKQLEHSAGDRRLTGLADGMIKIWRLEGARGLWRGLSPTLLMTVPSQVTYMTCYDALRDKFLSLESRNVAAADLNANPLAAVTLHSLGSSLIAGALARSISATLVTPLELVRTRLQATTTSKTSNLSALVRSLRGEVTSEGPLVLWRGLTATLWRDVPFSAIYFMGYEGLKRVLTGGGLGEGNAKDNSHEFVVAFVAGATSGTAAAVVTHPFDLLKTRLQASESRSEGEASQSQRLSNTLGPAGRASTRASSSRQGTLAAIRNIVAQEGTSGLWKGLTPRIAKVAPACGIMIASFEVVGRALAEADL
ncbi:mitochondrial carrier [Ceraceosorus guamensis]|uniref:Mitochondrial carrier n=1 Tax=Ceraceosorus guamensis TaxID=1522189 RepID=A0A316W5U6_9BASI|nr:mitochondrial carrier [Ceraceosorus guamensis]PWN45239.1 mitochondrial carrier [Ceraceosorus guamensis]